MNSEENNLIGASKNSGVITTDNSKIKVLVVPTDEEIMIARDTMALISE